MQFEISACGVDELTIPHACARAGGLDRLSGLWGPLNRHNHHNTNEFGSTVSVKPACSPWMSMSMLNEHEGGPRAAGLCACEAAHTHAHTTTCCTCSRYNHYMWYSQLATTRKTTLFGKFWEFS